VAVTYEGDIGYEGEIIYEDSYGGPYDGGCGCGDCGGGCGGGCSDCGDGWFGTLFGGGGCTQTKCGPSLMTAGVELTFLHPHFESNVAAELLESDGNQNFTFTDQEFAFDTKLAPRVWLDFTVPGNLGLRATWWEFDHDSDTFTASPPANGFGRITPPVFGDVDLSTTVPDSVYTATSQLFASTIDLEGTLGFNQGHWKWLAAAGVRFGEMEQTYIGSLTSAAGNQQGTINFRHQAQGVGPTAYFRAQRPFACGLALFGSARGALLFGESDSELNAVEDLDLDDQLTTRRVTTRDDILPNAEIQVGIQFTATQCGVWHPYFHVALEGQYWGGVGNASSEDGSMGFFGGNIAIGAKW
jgi:hypothetical protein